MIRTVLAAATLASLSTLSTADTAAAYERWVDITNSTGRSIYSVQISDVGRGDWGPDLLGRSMIHPGEMMRVEPYRHRGYCRFDILITYENGYQETLWRQNLCVMTDIEV